MNELLETLALGQGVAGARRTDGDPSRDQTDERNFWHGLIDDTEAAAFLGLTIRCLQGWRYKGCGPKFVRVSARCIRYRRAELRQFADARLRTSTSDPGPEAA